MTQLVIRNYCVGSLYFRSFSARVIPTHLNRSYSPCLPKNHEPTQPDPRLTLTLSEQRLVPSPSVSHNMKSLADLRSTPPSSDALRHSGDDNRLSISATDTLYFDVELSSDKRPGTVQNSSPGFIGGGFASSAPTYVIDTFDPQPHILSRIDFSIAFRVHMFVCLHAVQL